MERLRLQQQLPFGEIPQQKAKRADIFSVMMVPTLVYAMLYTFLLYDNFHSITLPLFVVVTIGYCGYVLFCIIQIFSLFLGKMQHPAGYTYARYAREGFFQLLFVCMINVCLVLFFMGCFRENGLKKILLTVISGCTYVMIASSAFRMCLYIQN